MALEDLTGATKYLNALVPTNPDPLDAKSQGDDHIRGIKNVLLNTFGAVAAPVDVVNTAKKNANETITGQWTFTNTLNAELPIILGKAVAGVGGNVRMKIDTGVIKWLVGVLGSAAAVNFSIYDITNGREAMQIASADDAVSVLNRANQMQRVSWHPSQINCGTRAFALSDVGNILRNDGASVFTLGPASAAGDFLRINNYGSSLTIARGGQNLVWLRGGTLASGADRTIAPYSSVDLVYTAGNEWTITGNGIS